MGVCTGTGYDIDHCQTEKMGCLGCYYFKNEQEIEDQKTDKCIKNEKHQSD